MFAYVDCRTSGKRNESKTKAKNHKKNEKEPKNFPSGELNLKGVSVSVKRDIMCLLTPGLSVKATYVNHYLKFG